MNKNKSPLWPKTKSLSLYEMALKKQLPSTNFVNNNNNRNQQNNLKRKQDQMQTKNSSIPVIQPAPKKTKIENSPIKQDYKSIVIPGTQLTNDNVAQFLRIVSSQTSQSYQVSPAIPKELNFSLLSCLENMTPSLLETSQTFKRPGQHHNPFKNLFQSLQSELVIYLVSFLDLKSISMISRASKSFYELIGNHFEFIMSESCHFHFHPSNAQDMELLIKGQKVKYLTGKGFSIERVLSSSQSLKYLELNVGESLHELNQPNTSYPNLIHLKLQGNTVNNFFSSILALQPMFQHLNGVTIEQPDKSTNALIAANDIKVVNVKKGHLSVLESLEGKVNLEHLKIEDCSNIRESVGLYLDRCHSLRVLYLGKVLNCKYIPDVEELAISNSRIKLADLISNEPLGKKLKILDLRGTVLTDSDEIYEQHKKLTKFPPNVKEEIILRKLLDWMKPYYNEERYPQPNILKIILTDSELYYYGISSSGKGFEWWTRYTTVNHLYETLAKVV